MGTKKPAATAARSYYAAACFRRENIFAASASGQQLTGELSGEGCLVPILPGFDETSVLDARDGSACDFQALMSLLVLKRCGPMEADQVAFGKQGNFLDFKFGEFRTDLVVETVERFAPTIACSAIVKNAFRGKKLLNGLAPAFIPDFTEPAKDDLFILVGCCLCLWGGHVL